MRMVRVMRPHSVCVGAVLGAGVMTTQLPVGGRTGKEENSAGAGDVLYQHDQNPVTGRQWPPNYRMTEKVPV